MIMSSGKPDVINISDCSNSNNGVNEEKKIATVLENID